MDTYNFKPEKAEPLLAVTSPVEESKLGLPPAVLAGLACVIPFLGSILGIVEREQPFVRHYSIQALVYWIVAFFAGWLSKVLLGGDGFFGMLLHLIFFVPMLLIFLVLVTLLALLAAHAFTGATYYLPYTEKYLVGPLSPLKQARTAANNVASRRS